MTVLLWTEGGRGYFYGMRATLDRNIRLFGVTKIGVGRGASLPSEQRKQLKTFGKRKTKENVLFAPFLLFSLVLLQTNKALVYNLDQTAVTMVTGGVADTLWCSVTCSKYQDKARGARL